MLPYPNIAFCVKYTTIASAYTFLSDIPPLDATNGLTDETVALLLLVIVKLFGLLSTIVSALHVSKDVLAIAVNGAVGAVNDAV
jgi:hypothetical protein